MARQYSASSASSTSLLKGTGTPLKTNWTKCVLCQDETTESTRCPGKSLRSDKDVGYKTLAANLLAFQDLDQMPMNINLQRVDDGGGIANTLMSNNASWHFSCFSSVNNQKVQRATKRKLKDEIKGGGCSPVKTRQKCDVRQKNDCFFCEKPGQLHRVQTFLVDEKVRKCATDLNETRLLAKLAEGDMVAIAAVYHSKCLAELYNRHNRLMSSHKEQSGNNSTAEGIVLAEIISFIEGAKDNVPPVFKLSDLVKMYSQRLSELGVELPERVNSTRLKDRIMKRIPELTSQTQGRDVLLVFEADIAEAVRSSYTKDADGDAIHLVRAANIVRHEMFEQSYNFEGSFDENCEENVAPKSLMALISMILEGTNIKDQKCKSSAKVQSALSIVQLVMFNSVKRSHGIGQTTRHNRVHETPLPIYISMKLHGLTRQRQLIDTFHGLGLSISYDRYMQISTDIGNAVCQRYEQQNIVCPAILKKEIFTAGMVDNVDHNTSSRQAQDAFHGTGISVVQFPTEDNPGQDQEVCKIDQSRERSKKLLPLPAHYTQVQPLALQNEDSNVPLCNGQVTANTNILDESRQKELHWLNTVHEMVQKPLLEDGDNVSWSAYHASQLPQIPRPLSNIALLPLFNESAHTFAMIRHAMDLVKTSVEHLNPGQTPVITMDQPLYAICKKIQWVLAGPYAEDQFVVMLGPLHTEMAFLRSIGDWLADSGWTSALTQADVFTSGRADAALKGSHVTRSRYAHEVTAASLHLLQSEAYEMYVETTTDDQEPLPFSDWVTFKKSEQPQFFYWDTVKELECLFLQYIRSVREGDFESYVQVAGQLVPWFFSMGLTNYARWLPIHVRDMSNLHAVHPAVFQEFQRGHFAVQKTPKLFSSIGMDQAHEQENETIKGVGGVIGLTENPSALHRWMVSGPEIARLISEFERSFDERNQGNDIRHHEQNISSQRSFIKDVKSLSETIKELGNPFNEESGMLIALDTKNVLDETAIQTMKNIQTNGQVAYAEYVEERLLHQQKPVSDTIARPKSLLFSAPPSTRQKSKLKQDLAVLKNDATLFSRMYISCQSRSGDIDDFFKHENLSYAPSLSNVGQLRQGTKSDLLTSLNKCAPYLVIRPAVDAMIIDGAAMIHMLSPGIAKTFHAYATDVVLPYLQTQLQNVNRLDVIWDRYIAGSLKESSRNMRGSGTRKRVTFSSPIPTNWSNFLRVDENKKELFNFLASQITTIQVEGKVIISTYETGIVSTTPVEDEQLISPCTHEEADSRSMLHVAHCVQQGYTKICIRTVDTDMVVLAVATVHNLNNIETIQSKIEELWLAFGTGKTYRYIPAHQIATQLGPQKSIALPLMHALTGCDTVSSFCGKGKKSAWEAWNMCPAVTEAFVTLVNHPETISSEVMDEIERYVVVLYNRTCPLSRVNEARRYLFSQGNRAMEYLPPTQHALVQHVLRATYQGGHVWGQCLVSCPVYPDPDKWGWIKNGSQWSPRWTTLPDASTACKELVSCGCHPDKGCHKLCKCKRANLTCTELCKCRGGCSSTSA